MIIFLSIPGFVPSEPLLLRDERCTSCVKKNESSIACVSCGCYELSQGCGGTSMWVDVGCAGTVCHVNRPASCPSTAVLATVQTSLHRVGGNAPRNRHQPYLGPDIDGRSMYAHKRTARTLTDIPWCVLRHNFSVALLR